MSRGRPIECDLCIRHGYDSTARIGALARTNDGRRSAPVVLLLELMQHVNDARPWRRAHAVGSVAAHGREDLLRRGPQPSCARRRRSRGRRLPGTTLSNDAPSRRPQRSGLLHMHKLRLRAIGNAVSTPRREARTSTRTRGVWEEQAKHNAATSYAQIRKLLCYKNIIHHRATGSESKKQYRCNHSRR